MSAGFESDQNGCKASQRKVCGVSGRSFACCGFKTPGRCPKSQVDQEQLRVRTIRRMARAQEASANYTAFHIYVGNRGHGIPCISLIYREILLLAIQNIIPILGLIDGLGVDPAPQSTAEGALAAKTFAAEFFTSWVGSACPEKKKVSNSYKPKNRSRCHFGAVKCIVTTALATAPQCTELVKSPTTASVCGFKWVQN